MIIYHNPRCSKSRQTLALLQDKGEKPQIIEYLKTDFTKESIEELLKKLDISAQDLIRKNDAKKLGIDLNTIDNDCLIIEIAKNPALIERPIVITDKGACICRPPEKVYDVL